MKILYGIQGTGNGHISRARAIYPLLKEIADVDILLSGYSAEIEPGFPVTFSKTGFGFTFGRNGGIDLTDSIIKARPLQLWQDINSLPVDDYEMVISDFEPVTAWAAKKKSIPCIGLSHQASFLSEDSPRPTRREWLGEMIFRYYAPTSHYIGFHYQSYDSYILTPVVRDEIRFGESSDRGHITMYLPAFSPEKLMPLLRKLPRKVQLFSKHVNESYMEGNVMVRPVDQESYTDSLLSCTLLVCGAGFESPSEALHIGKRLICIPMKQQYEQKCNAEALKKLGVCIVTNPHKELSGKVREVLNTPAPEPMYFPDVIPEVCSKIRHLYLSFYKKPALVFSPLRRSRKRAAVRQPV
ncbi:MAG: hypothetical protein LAT67_11805 [Balneolales bacterium]|nr:hypothetical protein [Balneolales bacterium]